MSRSLLFTVTAALAAVFGFAFLLMPGAALSLYGVTADPVVAGMGRLIGGLYLAMGLLAWYARDAKPSRLLRKVVLVFAVGFALGALGSLSLQLSGALNALGWSSVALDVLLAAAFAAAYRQHPHPQAA